MTFDRLFTTIDFHTAGIGMRLVTSGLERLPGATIAAKRRHFQDHLDHVRTRLTLEPRGHRGMLIAVLTEPVTAGADFGLVFMFPGGYYVSCGEATIGAATAAVETGMVARRGTDTPVVIDTEAGVVETVAHLDGTRVRAVTLRWTPAFVALPDQTVKVTDLGEVALDICVGAGNVFAVVEAPHLGLAVRPALVGALAARGMAVRAAVNEQLALDIPGLGTTPVENVIVHEPPDRDNVSRNALVWGPGQVDVAPCGSGTCARMALLHRRGRLGVGDTLVSEGLSGLRFRGTIVRETAVEAGPAIMPAITGTAYITGFSQLLFDPDDPLRNGLLWDR